MVDGIRVCNLIVEACMWLDISAEFSIAYLVLEGCT